MKIKRQADGMEFEGPDNTPVPAGYSQVPSQGPLATAPPAGPLSAMVQGKPVQGQRSFLDKLKVAATAPQSEIDTALGGNKLGQAIRAYGIPAVAPFGPATKAVGLVPKIAQGIATAAKGGAYAGGQAALEGKKAPEIATAAGLGATAQPVVGGLTKGLGYLASTVPAKLFGSRTGRNLAAWFKQQIPAFAEYPTNARGLNAMALRDGPQVLSRSYARALQESTSSIPPEFTVDIPAAAAKVAGLPGEVIEIGTGPSMIRLVKVNARRLVEALPTFGENQSLKHEALDALAAMGERVPALREANRQYMLGSGLIEWAEKSGALAGERYDPVKGMAALDKRGAGQALFRRGMGEVADIIRGPGGVRNPLQPPMTRYQPGGLGYQVAKEGIGGAAGLALGGPLGAGAGMLGAALMPRPAFYRNVPPGPLSPQLQELRRRLAAQAAAGIGRATSPDAQ